MNPAFAGPATQPFVIGVFSQPRASMPAWKALGINTFVAHESEGGKVELEWWAGTAALQNCNTIRAPSTRPDWEAWDSHQAPAGGIAFMLGDEPDGNGVDVQTLAAQAATFAKTQHGPATLPVFCNVRGGSLNGWQNPPVPVEQYLAVADWLAFDFYAITGWTQPSHLLEAGKILDNWRSKTTGKPWLVFVECSKQQLAWVDPALDRCATPDEVRAIAWDAVIHGASGVVYFPQQFNPFVFDAIPTDVRTEIDRQNRLLAMLDFSPGQGVNVPSPFECCLRTWNGQPTFILLNTGTTPATLPTGQNVPPHAVVFDLSNPFDRARQSAMIDSLTNQIALLKTRTPNRKGRK